MTNIFQHRDQSVWFGPSTSSCGLQLLYFPQNISLACNLGYLAWNMFKIVSQQPYPLETIWAMATVLNTVISQQFSMNIGALDLIAIAFSLLFIMNMCLILIFVEFLSQSPWSQVKLPCVQVNLNYFHDHRVNPQSQPNI